MPNTPFPEIDATARELKMLQRVFSIYRDYLEKREEEWAKVPWPEVQAFVSSTMEPEVQELRRRVNALPKKVQKEIAAWGQLDKELGEVESIVIPLLKALTSEALATPRAWAAVTAVLLPDERTRAVTLLSPSTAASQGGSAAKGAAKGGASPGGRGRASSLVFPVKFAPPPAPASPAATGMASPGVGPLASLVIPALADPAYSLGQFLSLPLVEARDEILRIIALSEEQSKVEGRLKELTGRWMRKEELAFRQAGSGTAAVRLIDRGDETLAALNQSKGEVEELMARSDVIEPFLNEVQALQSTLVATAETLQSWLRVQDLRLSLHAFFVVSPAHKENSRHLPRISVRFTRLDRDFSRLMQSAAEKLVLVTRACGSDLVKAALPNLEEELGRCRRAVEEHEHHGSQH